MLNKPINTTPAKFPVLTKKRYVMTFLNKNPNADSDDLYDRFPSYNKGTLRSYLKIFRDNYNAHDLVKEDILIFYRMVERKTELVKKLKMEEKSAVAHIERYLKEEFGDEFMYG